MTDVVDIVLALASIGLTTALWLAVAYDFVCGAAAGGDIGGASCEQK